MACQRPVADLLSGGLPLHSLQRWHRDDGVFARQADAWASENTSGCSKSPKQVFWTHP